MRLHHDPALKVVVGMRRHGCSWPLVWAVLWDVDHMLFANAWFCHLVWKAMKAEPGTCCRDVERRLRKAFPKAVVERAKRM